MQGDHLVGKYCCLLCAKEFSSESGVKYHILKAHAEVGRPGCRAGPAQLAGWAVSGWRDGDRARRARPARSRVVVRVDSRH